MRKKGYFNGVWYCINKDASKWWIQPCIAASMFSIKLSFTVQLISSQVDENTNKVQSFF